MGLFNCFVYFDFIFFFFKGIVSQRPIVVLRAEIESRRRLELAKNYRPTSTVVGLSRRAFAMAECIGGPRVSIIILLHMLLGLNIFVSRECMASNLLSSRLSYAHL